MYYCSSRRGKQGEKAESLFKEIMAENFTNLRRDLDVQVHETHSSPKRVNPKCLSPKHISKLSKNQRILKAVKGKKILTYEGISIKPSVDFSKETYRPGQGVRYTPSTSTERKTTSHQEYLPGRDFPGGTAVKNPPANAGDTGSIPGLGRAHMPRNN